MNPRGGAASRPEGGGASSTTAHLPLEEGRGVEHKTASSSSEFNDEMLKQIPSGDREVPAPGEGVDGVASGLRFLDLVPEWFPEDGCSSPRQG